MILNKIIDYKRKKIEEEKRNIPLQVMIDKIKDHRVIGFKKAIKDQKDISIIGEVKKASPSKGIIRKDFDPLDIARTYDKKKIEAISILTEDLFFQGKKEYLLKIAKEVSLPILRKDFIIDPYQIYESKVLGASAILLIAGILSYDQLVIFQEIAKEIGLECLVEVHDELELKMVLDTQAKIIGINNRDLKTFKTSIERTESLIGLIPRNKVIISESGINTRKDLLYLKDLGVDGVLIGEGFMRSKSIDDKIREFRGK